MTPTDAKKLVVLLLATFPSAKIEPAQLDAEKRAIPNTGTAATYARLLADLDPIAAAAAIDRVAATHRFPTVLPSIGEIREAAFALTAGPVEPGGVAWGAVRKLLHGCKAHRGYSTNDPPPQVVVERFAGPSGWLALEAIGGWRAMCCAEEDDPAPRSQFVKAYDAIAANARRDELSGALPAVARFHELQAAAEHKRLDGAQPISRAMLALAAHPQADSDPDAQRAIAEAREELRRRGQPVHGAARVGDVVAQLVRSAS